MARRAVQGYTEKSYYENTRYLGMLATSDPLNEGYFKHLVNFDISDTGQSVAPRKGFLTTTIKNNSEIRISNNSIIFKDPNIGEFIIYDIDNNVGYRVDVSAYNVENYLLPVTAVINVDLGSLIDANIIIQQDVKIEHVFDENTVSKTIFKATVNNDIIPLAVYYREESVDLYGVIEPGNTLVVEPIILNQHPTYDPTNRNIACSKSIIPENIQVIHTESSRPNGHIDSLGLIYFEDNNNQYLTNYIQKGVDYTITPHFEMNPAYITLNEESTATGLHWAYRWDIWSTETGVDHTATGQDVVFRSNWYKVSENGEAPVSLFPIQEGYDFTSGDISRWHYKGTTKVITVVYGEYLHINNHDIDANVLFGNLLWHEYEYNNLSEPRYNNWSTIINTIKDIQTLKNAIEALAESGAVFKVHDVTQEFSSTETFYTPLVIDDVIDTMVYTEYDKDVGSPDVVMASFLTGTQVINLINQGEFDEPALTFRLLPVTLDIYRTEDNVVTEKRVEFYSRAFWNPDIDPDADTLFTTYNKFNYYDYAYPFADYNGYWIYRLRTSILHNTTVLPDFEKYNFFDNGYHIRFYMMPYDDTEFFEDNGVTPKDFKDLEQMKLAWDYKAFQTDSSVRQYTYDSDLLTYITKVQPKDPAILQSFENVIKFEDDKLVIWKDNKVYISEVGYYYHFKEKNKFEFSEKVIKVLDYKEILLVFTTQHLYAIYKVVETATDEEGNTTTSATYYAKQRVLYNILVDERYTNVIQIFNDYILFYSADGQMYLIKPNTMIDSETRFTLKFFNKSVNDILQNYDQYINERLDMYGIDRINKEDVKVDALVDVNFIKIFYYIPGYITYILVYDVINNRYYTYDTTTFTDIKELTYVDSGNMYITRHTQNAVSTLLFTVPYTEYADISFVNNFQKIPIYGLLDTGNMNLNNHLRKRFRDLQIAFKNLSANELLYNVETVLDDVVSHPFYSEELEIVDKDGSSYYITVKNPNHIDLIDANTISENANDTLTYALNEGLFEFIDVSDVTSNKLIVSRSSILGMGRVFRLKMQFVSQGKYKIQRYGIVYKERRI